MAKFYYKNTNIPQADDFAKSSIHQFSVSSELHCSDDIIAACDQVFEKIWRDIVHLNVYIKLRIEELCSSHSESSAWKWTERQLFCPLSISELQPQFLKLTAWNIHCHKTDQCLWFSKLTLKIWRISRSVQVQPNAIESLRISPCLKSSCQMTDSSMLKCIGCMNSWWTCFPPPSCSDLREIRILFCVCQPFCSQIPKILLRSGNRSWVGRCFS